MKSAIYFGKENVKICEMPIPAVGEHDILVKNIYSSICGTDTAVFTQGEQTGHKITVGSEFGHETVSRIVAVGSCVNEFKVGERVYPYPLFAKADPKRAGTLGGFSEYMLLPNATLNHSVYRVPDGISDKRACLIEPFTVGCRAARRALGDRNRNAAVFGCGTIGIAAAIALKYFSVEKVLLCDRSQFRLHIAQQLGFETCHMNREDFREKAAAYTGTAMSLNGSVPDIDLFIDAAGAEQILDLFIACGKIESRFVSVAVNQSIRKLDLLHLTYGQKSIIGSGGYMPQDVEDVFCIMQQGNWDIESIITHEFLLDDITKAIQTAADVDGALNVVIKFEQ